MCITQKIQHKIQFKIRVKKLFPKKIKQTKTQPKKQNNKRRFAITLCLLGAVVLFGNTLYIQAKAQLAQYLIASAWEKTVANNAEQAQLTQTYKPWSWADTYPVAKLSMPAHGVEQYVLNGATGASLAFASGLYAGTKVPSASPSTLADTVIAGHHNTHFDFLKRVKVDETLRLQTFSGAWQTYRVSAVKRYDIRKQRLPALRGGKTLQLVTCLPSFAGEIHPNERLVVMAVRED